MLNNPWAGLLRSPGNWHRFPKINQLINLWNYTPAKNYTPVRFGSPKAAKRILDDLDWTATLDMVGQRGTPFCSQGFQIFCSQSFILEFQFTYLFEFSLYYC